MATSVKMRDADKERLDRLQAVILAETGEKLTQQELLSRLLNLAEGRWPMLVHRPTEATAEQIEELLALPMDTGQETTEEEIDEILYGDGDP